MDQLNLPATVSVSFGPSHDLTRTPPAAVVEVPLTSSAAMSAGLYQLALGDFQPHTDTSPPPPPIETRNAHEAPRDNAPFGSFPDYPLDNSGWSPARSPVHPPAPPSRFEQPPPEEIPTLTDVSDRPILSGPPRVLSVGPSTANSLNVSHSRAHSRERSTTQLQQRVDALREEEHQLKIYIERERERAHREYMMHQLKSQLHQKEAQDSHARLQQLAMREHEAMLAVSRNIPTDSKTLPDPNSSYSTHLMIPIPRQTSHLHRTPLAQLLVRVQVLTLCAASNQLPYLTRIRRQRFAQLPRHKSNHCSIGTLFLRVLVPQVMRYPDRVRTPILHSSGQFERNRSFYECSHLYTLAAPHISLQLYLR